MAISVRLCSGRTAFEVSTGTRIDLIKAGAIFKCRVATKHLLLLNYSGVEVSMYPSGRMIVKAQSREESLDIARRILSELEKDENDQKCDKRLEQ